MKIQLKVILFFAFVVTLVDFTCSNPFDGLETEGAQLRRVARSPQFFGIGRDREREREREAYREGERRGEKNERDRERYDSRGFRGESERERQRDAYREGERRGERDQRFRGGIRY